MNKKSIKLVKMSIGNIPELQIIHKNVLCGPTPMPHGTIRSADKCPKPNNRVSLIELHVDVKICSLVVQ